MSQSSYNYFWHHAKNNKRYVGLVLYDSAAVRAEVKRKYLHCFVSYGPNSSPATPCSIAEIVNMLYNAKPITWNEICHERFDIDKVFAAVQGRRME